MKSEDLTDEVKRLALEKGTDLIGVAPVERFREAPSDHHPQNVLPTAKNVVVFLKRLLDPIVDHCIPDHAELFDSHTHQMNSILARVTNDLAWRLYEKGYQAIPCPSVPVDCQYESTISNKQAAVQAGLGEIGVNNLLLTPEYGPRVKIYTLITDAPLRSDGSFDGKICNECFSCVEACPSGAIRRDRLFQSRKCIMYPIGLNREKPTEEIFRDLIQRVVNISHFCARCIKVCPIGNRR